uniref:EVI5-like protein isoform X1 n=1 Tax=Styela clava TaxID=7725 RepID=UPI001939297E|nr:EVI5-like protein isoform X1 [Styela clava]
MLASQQPDLQRSKLPSFADHFKKGVLGRGKTVPSKKTDTASRISTNSREISPQPLSDVNSLRKDLVTVPVIQTNGFESKKSQNISVIRALTPQSSGAASETDKSVFSNMMKPIFLAKVQDNKSQDSDANSNGSYKNCRELSEEEHAILAKIEAQNKLLEADTKSLKSISSEGGRSTSRRSSGGSISPTSVHSNLSVNGPNDGNSIEDDQWQLWGRIVNDWDEFKKKREKQLKENVRKGIPHHFRGIVWQLLCGAHRSPIKDKYSDLLKQESPSAKLIKRDIARTYPDQDFFKEKIGQEVLFNVTKAYSLVDREVGYCQGSAFIAGLLLMQMPEEEAFAVFVALMRNYRLRELFKPSMAELGLCMFQLDNMLQEHAPDLYNHFQAQGFHTSMYASSWFLTLFATTFNLQVASRIMDVFMSEGMEIIFRIGLAMLLSSHNQLLQLDMEGMLKVILKTLPEFYNRDPDLLFNKAYTLVKYNPKKMKKIEKEYMSMKTKEMEEQVEMRRLRTECRLLRQRVDALEKENENLADKLIQDRVNRALEAEEKIIMGKELSIAKRQVKLSQSSLNNLAQQDNPFALSHDGDFGKPPVSSTESTPSTTSTEPKTKPAPQSALSVPYSEDFVLELQQELIQARLREAECSSTLTDLQDKVSVLEKKNKELTDKSKVTILQEELIAVKLREAEATGSLKQLQQKVNSLEDNWQSHMTRISGARKSPASGSKVSKAALQELQEELMSAKFRETQLTSQNLDSRQKVMELETSNQICTSQLRRADEERTQLRNDLEKSMQREKNLQQQLNEINTRMAHVESKSQETLMAMRLREADGTMEIAEMKQQIQSLEAKCADLEKLSNDQKVEKSTSENASSSYSDFKVSPHPNTAAMLQQLQEKILHQQKVISKLRKTNNKNKAKLRRGSQDSLTAVDDKVFQVGSESSDPDTDSSEDDTELILDSTLTDPDKVLNTDIKITLPPQPSSLAVDTSLNSSDLVDPLTLLPPESLISPPDDFKTPIVESNS